jgi:hypothetical protein
MININAAIKNIQLASIQPNLLIPPLAFVEEKKTMYPTTAHKVAGP